MKVNLNSVTNSKQVTNVTDRQKDKEKEKEKFCPILPYYIINNHLYSSNYNSPKNPKTFHQKKNKIMNNTNNNYINKNIKNISKNIIKNNSSLSSYNHFNYYNNHHHHSRHNLNSKKKFNNEIKIKSVDYSPSIKDKILSFSKNNHKTNNLKNNQKKINFDYNILIKKSSNPNKQKSSHDIFYNENKSCYTLNSTETKKKNRPLIITSLNTSKNSNQDKIKINSKKKLYKFNHNNKQSSQTNLNDKLALDNSSKNIRSKNSSSNKNNFNDNNTKNKNAQIYKKNHAKFINNNLYYPDKNKYGINFFINYLKGANYVIANNSNSYKSISINSTGNISYKKPKIKIGFGEIKNDIINKEYYYKNNISKPSSNNNYKINSHSSIKSKKYIQNTNTRSLSIKNKNDKNGKQNNIKSSNLYSLNLKNSSLNNSKINLKQLLSQYQIDSPFYKYCHKTTGNYFVLNDNINNNSNIKNNNNNYTSYNFYKKYNTIKSQQEEKNILKNNYIINNNEDYKTNNQNDNNQVNEKNYTIKINKIIKDSMQEISKIKNDFAKHFTANNSPQHKNDIQTKRDLETNNNNNNYKNLYLSKKYNYNYNSNNNSSKNIIKDNKKSFKNSVDKKDNSKKKIIFSPKKKTLKNKTQSIKHLTHNNSKVNIKNIKLNKKKHEMKKENLKIELKKIPISNEYNPTLTHSSRSGINDSFYYLRESQKLSEFIKNYYKKYKKYPDTNLNFYKYGRLIGQGAFGKVNLGLNILTGRIVAIKSFNKSNLNSNSENMKKILYETNLMKKLNHPNITKILELFEDKEYILIIMEYINGGNLFSFLKKRRKVSEKTAKFLFKQIILGIKYIHSHNIVHRDIKLENILIDLNNNIKICDFGIGRVLSSPDQLLYDQCGTPMYIAPEILLSTKEKGYKGFPVDIWSSGIALYILLSGNLPFNFKNTSVSIQESEKNNDNNSEELQFSIVNNEPKHIENISDEARDLLKGLLNKNPAKRLTCEQVLDHPWLKDVNQNLDNSKYHLFTKAEMKMLSKTYVDYRKDKSDNLKEIFTLSNLFSDKNDNKNEKNIETKSSILAPFNSVIKDEDEYDDEYNYYDLMDDLTNDKIHLENGIITIGHKVKEFNMLYEMNNNCEVDNGIIINSRTNTVTSESNNSINTFNNNSIIKNEDSISKTEKVNNKIKNNKNSINKSKKVVKENKNNENIKEINNILNQLESLGYNKNYVKECVKNNVLCHASTAYFLMLNYDKI